MLETISKIESAKALLNKAPPDEMKFRPSFEMAVNTAKTDLPKLYVQLAEDVAKVAVPVYVVGEKAETLAKAMQDQTASAVVDVGAVFDRLVQRIAASVGRSNEFGVNQFSLLVQELRQLGIENSIPSMTIPKFSTPETFDSPEGLKKIVLRYARMAVGDDLAVNYIRTKTSEQVALVVKEKVPVFPVFVLNADVDNRDTLTKRLFKRNVDVVVNAPPEVDEDAAIKALKTIKSALKGTKEKDN